MATGDKMIELIADMNGKIGELCGDIKSVMKRLEKGDEKLADHERRLMELETKKAVEQKSPALLTTIVSPLAKYGPWIVMALILIIMKLTGTQAPAVPD